MVLFTVIFTKCQLPRPFRSGDSNSGQAAVIGIDNSIYAKIFYPKLASLDNKMQLLSITGPANKPSLFAMNGVDSIWPTVINAHKNFSKNIPEAKLESLLKCLGAL